MQKFRDEHVIPLCEGMRDLTAELKTHAEEYRRLATANRTDIDAVLVTLHGPGRKSDGLAETVKQDHATMKSVKTTVDTIAARQAKNPLAVFGDVGLGRVHASGLAAIVLMICMVLLFQLYFVFLLHGGKDPFGKWFGREPATTANTSGQQEGRVNP
jgi:hypothetical protein